MSSDLRSQTSEDVKLSGAENATRAKDAAEITARLTNWPSATELADGISVCRAAKFQCADSVPRCAENALIDKHDVLRAHLTDSRTLAEFRGVIWREIGSCRPRSPSNARDRGHPCCGLERAEGSGPPAAFQLIWYLNLRQWFTTQSEMLFEPVVAVVVHQLRVVLTRMSTISTTLNVIVTGMRYNKTRFANGTGLC